jgi:hypothetical protein
MVTRQAIRRLDALLDGLEARLSPRPKVATICVPDYLGRDAVCKRHYEMFPEDAGAENIVFITVYEGADPTAEPPPYACKSRAAWRALALEAA